MKIFLSISISTNIYWLMHKFFWCKVGSGSVEKSDGSGSSWSKIPGSSALLFTDESWPLINYLLKNYQELDSRNNLKDFCQLLKN